MKCDECSKPATIFLTQLVAGKVKKVALCEACAKEKGVTDPTGFALADLLLGGQASVQEAPVVVAGGASARACPDCGFTMEDMKKVRRFGCSTCYPTFRDEVVQMLRGMHKGLTHSGKVPCGKIEQQQRQRRLVELQEQLEDAVTAENYEEAAGLRDEIRTIESAMSSDD